MKITEVRAITCDIPLSRPIVMGELRYDSRDYILVEVRTDAGISGVGFGMGRYAPVARIVARNLTPLLLGEDPLLTEQLWDRLYYRNLVIGQQGIFMRALSAVDIALWDIKGKVANLPVWQLLGGARRERHYRGYGTPASQPRGTRYSGSTDVRRPLGLARPLRRRSHRARLGRLRPGLDRGSLPVGVC